MLVIVVFQCAMSETKTNDLERLWLEAHRKYKDERQAEISSKKEKEHFHVFRRSRKYKNDTPIPHAADEEPKFLSAKDFQTVVEKRKTEFEKMRGKNHGVFEAMSSLVTPLTQIGGQAAAIGSVVSDI